MKKINCFMIMAVLIMAACQPKPQPIVVDLAASKAEVNTLMETYLTAFNAKDVATLAAIITDDGLFCGTDPGEIMDKKTVTDAWTSAFADTTLKSFVVDKREIRVASDGNSAIIMEQFYTNPYDLKLPWRLVSRAVKAPDGWKLDFISWSFIPKNEDILKVMKAME
jgi:ketosteroid isomerase-like protein